jgi:beta-galactosidase GanA
LLLILAFRNLHQPEENGDIIWDGLLDLPRFLATAQKVGLLVTLRPPPYICAEWEWGGMPAWLLRDPEVVVRASEPKFLAAVERFMTVLLQKVYSYQYHLGGPIIIMQIENEYGNYGSDHQYLRLLKQMFDKNGIKTLLNTCNGFGFRTHVFFYKASHR